MTVKKKQVKSPRKRGRPVRAKQSNIGKGPNININIDQSKRSTKKAPSQPQRAPQIISTVTPSYVPFPLPTQNNNPFDSVVKETQKKVVKEENELEKPKPKTKEEEPINADLFNIEPLEQPAPKPKNKKNIEIQTEPLEDGPLLYDVPMKKNKEINIVEMSEGSRRSSPLETKSSVMTIADLNNKGEEAKEKPKIEMFPGEGKQLSDVHLKLTPKQLRQFYRESYQEIQPPPKQKDITNFMEPSENDFEQYKQLTQEFKKAEKATQEEKPKEDDALEEKTKYEKYIRTLNKEKLKEEADKKGIDVKGKSIKQVRNSLLGIEEEFKLEPLSEEKQMINIQEEKRKKFEAMTNNKLEKLLEDKGIILTFKNVKGKKQKKTKAMMVNDLMI
jgi:hypothetical protein